MNAQKLPRHLQKLADQLERYAINEFPGMAGNKILRFINGNFRAQGWQGRSFQRWKANRRNSTILIRRGHGRRSIRQETRPGIVRTWSDSPYMAVHNRGFKGKVSIREHQRRKYEARRVPTGRKTKSGNDRMKTVHVNTGTSIVKGHTRNVNIPKRQFMPESWNDSPVLVNSIRRDVVKTMKSIFNT